MTQPLGTYSFLPWLRQGLANQITAADLDPNVKTRPQITVELALEGDKLDGSGVDTLPVTKSIALFGPGDIAGIDRRAIVRTEPRDGVTNFEPNYLACIEFYDEDFPWRYTPAAPDLAKRRLRPWITLLVLKDDGTEFSEGQNVTGKPLPHIDVLKPNLFPPADELWAWAHVHVNRSLASSDAEFVSEDMAAVIPRLTALLAENADLAYSRLICPRKLAANTGYHAFLIPTFETGRRAGLGLGLDDIAATMSSWDSGPRPQSQSYPIYHRWYFRTGTTGDFETLVRLIRPKPVDPRVGVREMDVQDPRSNVRGLDKPELGGILKLGGALQPPANDPPDPPDMFETWDEPFPRPLQEDLAELINLPEQYLRAGDPDPIITPPLYGTWHALVKRVLTSADGTSILPAENWVHRLNLDPRFRVAAGLGTRVVQDQQEQLMDAAWSQVGKLLEVQRRIRLGQFATQVSQVWFDRHLGPTLAVDPQRMLMLLGPLNKRIVSEGITLHHRFKRALVQPTLTSSVFRRVVRPRGRLVRSLRFNVANPVTQLIARANLGTVTAAPPRVTPFGLLTREWAARDAVPKDAPAAAIDALRSHTALPLTRTPTGRSLLAAYGSRRLLEWQAAVQGADALREVNMTVAAIDRLPGVSNFELSDPAAMTRPFTPRIGADSVEAARFKQGLRDAFELVEASAAAGARPKRSAIDLNAAANASLEALRPTRTIPARVRSGVRLPPRIQEEQAAGFVEPMAYPVIDLPMYEPLKNLSAELFLPNIDLIARDSITLMEANQRFIEAYMVGLNHEFARELLWREFPTDQRGSPFRQFWDVRGCFNAQNLDDDALKESLRDIPPLHEWPPSSRLGTHNHRTPAAEDQKTLVLVIRSELLKRYPNAVIYAHRACWQRHDDGTLEDRSREPCSRSGAIDTGAARLLAPLSEAEEAAPPKTKVLTPLYEAKVDPDIYFFGFDLTVRQARGDTGENPGDDPGWFFVLKERPGEPRFGLDTDRQPTLNTWNDLSWQDVQPGSAGTFIEIASAPASFALSPPSGEDPHESAQFSEDQRVAWSHDMDSAELAYILFQTPVLIAVHASEMLPKP